MSDLSWLMYPPLESEKFFLSKVGFELADVSPPGIRKFFLSEVRFELADVPPPPGLENIFKK